jgi:hypothetical protein
MSRRPPANILRLVERAIDLRAAGNAWPTVAAALARKVETVRGWSYEYTEFWTARLAAVHAELDGEAVGEARHKIRQQMRSQDAKEQGEAIRLLVLLVSRRRPGEHVEPVPSPPEYRQIADHLRGLSDDQLRTYVQTQFDRLAR